jgi:hypothetical protein
MRLRTVVTFLAASAMLLAADVTGKWSFAVETGAGSGTPSFTFVQKGTALTGTYQGMVGEAPLKGKVEGDQIEFIVATGSGELRYSGKITGETTMAGKADYPEIGAATWTAKKEK